MNGTARIPAEAAGAEWDRYGGRLRALLACLRAVPEDMPDGHPLVTDRLVVVAIHDLLVVLGDRGMRIPLALRGVRHILDATEGAGDAGYWFLPVPAGEIRDLRRHLGNMADACDRRAWEAGRQRPPGTPGGVAQATVLAPPVSGVPPFPATRWEVLETGDWSALARAFREAAGRMPIPDPAEAFTPLPRHALHGIRPLLDDARRAGALEGDGCQVMIDRLSGSLPDPATDLLRVSSCGIRQLSDSLLILADICERHSHPLADGVTPPAQWSTQSRWARYAEAANCIRQARESLQSAPEADGRLDVTTWVPIIQAIAAMLQTAEGRTPGIGDLVRRLEWTVGWQVVSPCRPRLDRLRESLDRLEGEFNGLVTAVQSAPDPDRAGSVARPGTPPEPDLAAGAVLLAEEIGRALEGVAGSQDVPGFRAAAKALADACDRAARQGLVLDGDPHLLRRMRRRAFDMRYDPDGTLPPDPGRVLAGEFAVPLASCGGLRPMTPEEAAGFLREFLQILEDGGWAGTRWVETFVAPAVACIGRAGLPTCCGRRRWETGLAAACAGLQWAFSNSGHAIFGLPRPVVLRLPSHAQISHARILILLRRILAAHAGTTEPLHDLVRQEDEVLDALAQAALADLQAVLARLPPAPADGAATPLTEPVIAEVQRASTGFVRWLTHDRQDLARLDREVQALLVSHGFGVHLAAGDLARLRALLQEQAGHLGLDILCHPGPDETMEMLSRAIGDLPEVDPRGDGAVDAGFLRTASWLTLPATLAHLRERLVRLCDPASLRACADIDRLQDLLAAVRGARDASPGALDSITIRALRALLQMQLDNARRLCYRSDVPVEPGQTTALAQPAAHEGTMENSKGMLANLLGSAKARALAEIHTVPGEAATRIGASQVVKVVTSTFLGVVKRQTGKKGAATYAWVEKNVQSEPGQALVAGLVSLGLDVVPLGSKERRGALAHELRVRATAQIGNLLADATLGPVMGVLENFLGGDEAVAQMEAAGVRVESAEVRGEAGARKGNTVEVLGSLETQRVKVGTPVAEP
jgi:hypothetical protein